MISKLNTLKQDTYSWIKNEMVKTPFCYVKETITGRRKVEYKCGNNVFRLPTEGGIYIIYSIADDTNPIYIGEGGNLRQRVEYHLSESKSAKQYSTLKLKLQKKGFPVDQPTRDLIKFKYITIPFGRKEIELMLHEEFGINTKDSANKT